MRKRNLILSGCFLNAFALWTVLVSFVGVETVGPRGSKVGFATMNGAVHDFFGVNMTLYEITDWMGLVPVGIMFGFCVLGLVQWITRKNIARVDRSILVLGGFYIVVLIAYLGLEELVINYRPVLINGFLEASYPSSTTLLVLCVMPTAMLQLQARLQSGALLRVVNISIILFCIFMVLGRLISGVHWFSDIVGGILLSAGLVKLYKALA